MSNRRLAVLGLGLGFAASGCLDVNYQTPTPFQAELVGVSGEAITGSVAAVSDGRNSTETGITVNMAAARTVGWQINEGTCSAPGSMLGSLGAYPNITANAAGVGRVERTFVRALMEPDGKYHAVVVNATNRTQILACGNFSVKTF